MEELTFKRGDILFINKKFSTHCQHPFILLEDIDLNTTQKFKVIILTSSERGNNIALEDSEIIINANRSSEIKWKITQSYFYSDSKFIKQKDWIKNSPNKNDILVGSISKDKFNELEEIFSNKNSISHSGHLGSLFKN